MPSDAASLTRGATLLLSVEFSWLLRLHAFASRAPLNFALGYLSSLSRDSLLACADSATQLKYLATDFMSPNG